MLSLESDRLASNPVSAHLDSLLGLNEKGESAARVLAPVLMPGAPLSQTYDYIVPPGLEIDREDGGLDADEERLHERRVAESGIRDAERQDDERAGQHEQQSRCEATHNPMQAPARVRRKLHGLRPGQQHAEIESGEKTAFFHPPPFFDEHLVHQGDRSA